MPVYSLNSVIELGPACVVDVDDAEAERSKGLILGWCTYIRGFRKF